jgi:hypothetical protein
LFIIGLTLAIIFSKPASIEAELQMTDLGNEITNELDSDISSSGSSDEEWDPYYGNRPAPASGGITPKPSPDLEPTFSTQVSVNSSDPVINTQSNIPISPGLLFKLNSQKIKYGLSIGVGSVSAIIAVIAAVELIINASSNTWIRIILGIVGLILILVGTAFIYDIIKGFDSVGNLITSNALLKKLKNDSNDMHEWLKMGNLNNETVIDENNTINLNNTSLFNNNNTRSLQ